MNDIQTRADLELLTCRFYSALLDDASINYIFTDVAKLDLEQHLPHITDFWEQNLLHTANYRNNVMRIHLDLNDKVPLTKVHFDTWLEHFTATVDLLFAGNNAEIIKTRALSIATIMALKINHHN